MLSLPENLLHRAPTNRSRSLSTGARTLLQLAAAVAVGLAVGTLARAITPKAALMLLLLGGGVVLVANRPEIGILALLVATSTIVPFEALPRIGFGAFTLEVPDVIILSLLGLAIVRGLAEPNFRLVHTPIDIPLLLFYMIAVLSTWSAIMRTGIDYRESLTEGRQILGYAVFFAVTNLVRHQRQRVLLLRGVMGLALFVALAMAAQYALGSAVQILPGRVETLVTAGAEYSSVTRILPPGQALVLAAFLAQTAVLVVGGGDRALVMAVSIWGAAGIGVLTTFNRSFWGGAGLAVGVLALVSRGKELGRVVLLALALAVLGEAAWLVAAAAPKSVVGVAVTAAFGRMASFAGLNKVEEDSSFQWRYPEYEAAIVQIQAHPLTGLGLGAEYRQWDARLDSHTGFDGRRYIHNGHLYVLLKTGVLGYLALLSAIVLSLARSLIYWRRIPDLWLGGLVLGFGLTLLAILLACIVDPILVQRYWTPVLGLMMGVSEMAIGTIGQSGVQRVGAPRG